jgi:hypothetical protein
MQGTAEFHHQIADALPQADPVFDDATTLDTAVDMFDPQPTLGERLIRLLLSRVSPGRGFLGRHEDRHRRERERQKPRSCKSRPPPVRDTV